MSEIDKLKQEIDPKLQDANKAIIDEMNKAAAGLKKYPRWAEIAVGVILLAIIGWAIKSCHG